MTRIVVDKTIRSQLGDGKHILELCDDSGRIFGHFLPLLTPSQGNTKEPQISEEEIQSRLQAGRGRTLAEILADLGKMS